MSDQGISREFKENTINPALLLLYVIGGVGRQTLFLFSEEHLLAAKR